MQNTRQECKASGGGTGVDLGGSSRRKGQIPQSGWRVPLTGPLPVHIEGDGSIARAKHPRRVHGQESAIRWVLAVKDIFEYRTASKVKLKRAAIGGQAASPASV